jgi:rhodanese-related sulfurtransferase
MTNWLTRRSLNQKLALLAFVLGAVAVAASPYRGTNVTLDARELSVIVQTGQDHVTPAELASWIIENRADYRLIDLRSEAEFDAYHIPSARQVSVAGLPDAQLGRQEKIVLYADGGDHAAQAWMLLKASGYRSVYILRGGLGGWKDDVLFPALPSAPAVSDAARIERLRSISAFFGGTPGTAGPNAVAPARTVMPAVQSPSSPVAPLSAAKKKKEGC